MAIFLNNKDFLNNYVTMIDNAFISDYMPDSPENAVKVYLYGLYLSNLNDSANYNTLDAICNDLSITVDELHKHIDYWSDMGLIEIKSKNPLLVTYVSMLGGKRPIKKYSKAKYEDFNQNIQLLFPSRTIMPNEYNEYYELIEQYKIEPEALIMIAQYCVKNKGTSVRFPYIFKVARDWIDSNILTAAQVEERLLEYDLVSENLREVFKLMNKKAELNLEARQLYYKWTKEWNIDKDSILYCAAEFKLYTIGKLDKLLEELKTLNISSIEDITDYKNQKEILYDTAKTVVKRLGLYYASYEYIIEIYISKWFEKGYSKEAIMLIAHNCAIANIKNLEGMHHEINLLYGKWIINDDSVLNYYDEQLKVSERVQNIIYASGSKRRIRPTDIDNYTVWSNWGFDYDSLLCAAQLFKGKSQAFSYLSNLLSKCKENNVFTIEGIERMYKSGYNKDIKITAASGYMESNIKDKLKDLYSDDIDSDSGEIY